MSFLIFVCIFGIHCNDEHCTCCTKIIHILLKSYYKKAIQSNLNVLVFYGMRQANLLANKLLVHLITAKLKNNKARSQTFGSMAPYTNKSPTEPSGTNSNSNSSLHTFQLLSIFHWIKTKQSSPLNVWLTWN